MINYIKNLNEIDEHIRKRILEIIEMMKNLREYYNKFDIYNSIELHIGTGDVGPIILWDYCNLEIVHYEINHENNIHVKFNAKTITTKNQSLELCIYNYIFDQLFDIDTLKYMVLIDTREKIQSQNISLHNQIEDIDKLLRNR
jgi:hypothetical protein